MRQLVHGKVLLLGESFATGLTLKGSFVIVSAQMLPELSGTVEAFPTVGNPAKLPWSRLSHATFCGIMITG